jgi:cytochrome b pre-mRNA-processing protein 3
MLRHLFPRLTPAPSRGSALFKTLVDEARAKHWFVEGAIPETLDGRFAVLATVVALATVRLEGGGAMAHEQAVALAERFVEAMDAEHRQLGIGEPGLGKKVRKLVGALSRRVDLWRGAVDGGDWDAAVVASLSPAGEDEGAAVIEHRGAALRAFWTRLQHAGDDTLAEGKIG